MEINIFLLSKNITKYRLLARLNKKQLGEKTGLHPNYISQIEKGKDKLPSIETLTKIAEVLSVSIDQLLHDNLSVYSDKQNQIQIDEVNNELNKMTDEQLDFFLRFIHTFSEHTKGNTTSNNIRKK